MFCGSESACVIHVSVDLSVCSELFVVRDGSVACCVSVVLTGGIAGVACELWSGVVETFARCMGAGEGAE